MYWQKSSVIIAVFALGWFANSVLSDKNRTDTIIQTTSRTFQKTTENAQQPLSDQVLIEVSADFNSSQRSESVSSDWLLTVELLLGQKRFQKAASVIQKQQPNFDNAQNLQLLNILKLQLFATGLDSWLTLDSQSIEQALSNTLPESAIAQVLSLMSLQKEDPVLALANFDALASYYQTEMTELELKTVENWLLATVEQRLLAQKNWWGLRDWYQQVVTRANNPQSVYRRMARVYSAQLRYLDSNFALNQIALLETWNREDTQLYSSNTTKITQGQVTAVQLQKQQEKYLVPVRLNGRLLVSMLLDTGASISALDKTFIQSYGLQKNGNSVSLRTAGGLVESPLYNIDSMALGREQIGKLQLAELDLGPQLQGILGMDVLQGFEFYIDQNAALLYLRPVSVPQSSKPLF